MRTKQALDHIDTYVVKQGNDAHATFNKKIYFIFNLYLIKGTPRQKNP